jgi:glycosyltransferase involved in cell wall biosynthesis
MSIFKRYLAGKAENKYTAQDSVSDSGSIFVVIPCYNEPDLTTTLKSLASCKAPQSGVTVLVVVNSPENSTEEVLSQNHLTLSQLEKWMYNTFFNLRILHAPDLPHKYAGVGWARKIGMDEAVRQLYCSGQEDGILISFDADSTVSSNYLLEIEKAFHENPRYNFCTINFEHPLNFNGSGSLNEGILRYELHMRYYRNAMKWSGYPHAIHTVGSSFAVRASAYVKQGGMNRKKAGEDFYFLHKLVLLGNYGNISKATVFPSARQSDRVPFGTGAAMKKWEDGNPELMTTYNFDAFKPLKQFFRNAGPFYRMNVNQFNTYLHNSPDVLRQFILESATPEVVLELQNNCANELTFAKRFFHHMNAFWILKYLNFAHENFYNRGELFSQARKLLQEMDLSISDDTSGLQLLDYYRNLDKEL